MQSPRSSEEKDRILHEKINTLQKHNEETDCQFLEETQKMQLSLAEAQNAYNNLYHAVSTGQPLLEEEDDEEEEEIQADIPSSSILNPSKEPATQAPPLATPTFFEIDTPRTLPKVNLPDFRPAGGDAKLEPVSPDQKMKEADVIGFEPIGSIKAVRYWNQKPREKYRGQSDPEQPLYGLRTVN